MFNKHGLVDGDLLKHVLLFLLVALISHDTFMVNHSNRFMLTEIKISSLISTRKVDYLFDAEILNS